LYNLFKTRSLNAIIHINQNSSSKAIPTLSHDEIEKVTDPSSANQHCGDIEPHQLGIRALEFVSLEQLQS
jgi:hypothetical protein